MHRRSFIKETGIVVIGAAVFGTIQRSDAGYVGDTTTSSDVLGPYYRPGAPLRKNLNPENFAGSALHLKGTIFKEDGVTPVPDCMVEIWQCGGDGLYDNTSDEYLYRASQRVGRDGKYEFITAKPVPEPVEGGLSIFRPAHIHLRISSIGNQDLITQIYFKDDPYLISDPSTKSELSINRILSITETARNESEIQFDITLKKQVLASDELFQSIRGVYKMTDKSMMEFYRDGDLLFYKTNNQIWGALSYVDDHTFTGGVNDTKAVFEVLPQGHASVKFSFLRRRQIILDGVKVLQYK